MNHPLWQEFTNWVRANGVSLDHEDDWATWWNCFMAGAVAGTNATVESQLGPMMHELDVLKQRVTEVTKDAYAEVIE